MGSLSSYSPLILNSVCRHKTQNTAIVLMMETLSNSETCVNFYNTRQRKILEDSHLHSSRHFKDTVMCHFDLSFALVKSLQ
jgi:hypothetical protein